MRDQQEAEQVYQGRNLIAEWPLAVEPTVSPVVERSRIRPFRIRQRGELLAPGIEEKCQIGVFLLENLALQLKGMADSAAMPKLALAAVRAAEDCERLLDLAFAVREPARSAALVPLGQGERSRARGHGWPWERATHAADDREQRPTSVGKHVRVVRSLRVPLVLLSQPGIAKVAVGVREAPKIPVRQRDLSAKQPRESRRQHEDLNLRDGEEVLAAGQDCLVRGRNPFVEIKGRRYRCMAGLFVAGEIRIDATQGGCEIGGGIEHFPHGTTP